MRRITADTTVEELAGIVAEHLRLHGIEVVLSGGALVGIYSDGEYTSKDIDLITFATTKALESALAEIGFHKGPGRHFIHPQTDILVEFPRGPVAVGQEIVKDVVQLDTLGGRVGVLKPTDAVKDRLAGYLHWNHAASLAQAKLIARRHVVDGASIVAWAINEGASQEMTSRIRQMLKDAAEDRDGVGDTGSKTN
jgi:hypothetical protein